MRNRVRVFPLLFLALLVISALTAQAGPRLGPDNTSAAAEALDDTPQGREHRAGVQAQIGGKLDVAKGHYEASLRIDANYAPALVGLAAVAQAQGSLVQAEKHLRQAERVAPNAPEVHLAWGRYHLSRREMARAETSFRAAHTLAPKQIPPLLELGEVYLRMPGRSADALSAFLKATAIDANNPLAQYGLGVAAATAGQSSEAYRAFGRSAELAPKDPAPHRAMGRLHLEAKEFDKALSAFDAGLARQPGFVPLMLDRADALARMARWKEAIAQLTAAETLLPRSAEVKVKLGDVHQAAAQWQEAEKLYLQAISLDPKSPIAYNNLAWMTVERNGDASKAVVWARQAVTISPRSSPFHDTLGWAERAAGNLQAAVASFKRAIQLESNIAGYHYHLGVAQAELKQPAEARTALKRALELDRQLPQAEAAQRLLKSL